MANDAQEQDILINSPQFKVYREPALSLAVLEFNAETTSEIYRKGLKTLLKHSRQDNIYYWLISCEKGCAITSEDQNWTTDVVIPEIAKELELRKIAIIESNNIFERLNLISLFERLSIVSKIDIQFFELERNARNWLQEDSEIDF